MVNRLTRIYYRGVFFDYPIRPFNALTGLGLTESLRCLLSYGRAKLLPQRAAPTFQSWVTARFGRRLFEIFFKSYSEKLWGIPCDSLDSDFAAQRIKKFSLFEALKAAVSPQRGVQHKTLADQFAYPLKGSGSIYAKMADLIVESGGELRLNSEISHVDLPLEADRRPSIVLASGEAIEFDHVISSMPITRLVEKLNAPSDIQKHAKALSFRNTILVYLLVNKENVFPDQWIYVHAPELKTGRITNFRNWVPDIGKEVAQTILCMEYWCNDSEALWSSSDIDLVSLAKQEICQTKLICAESILEGKVVRIPKCYPVYKKGYKENLRPVETFLKQQSRVTVIGRYGAFKYNNQDHSILMGLLAAENIADGSTHDLWGINTDYEYQEATRITEAGLIAVRTSSG
jgi:protoporphyrinogen oxidase